MQWDAFQRVHGAFEASLSQIAIVGAVAEASLHTFPKNLPTHLSTPMASTLRELAIALERASVGLESGAIFATTTIEDLHPLAVEYMVLLINRQRGGGGSKIDLSVVARWQELVMVIAAIEAFLSETVRAVCSKEPNVLRTREKQISSEQVFAVGSYEALIAQIADKVVFAEGWGPLVKRLALPKIFGAAPAFDGALLRRLARADVTRNLIMHNGGVVNAAALAEVPELPPVGTALVVPRSELDALHGDAKVATWEVFATVSEKFFARSRDTLGRSLG
jgi:hypothetical protein